MLSYSFATGDRKAKLEFIRYETRMLQDNDISKEFQGHCLHGEMATILTQAKWGEKWQDEGDERIFLTLRIIPECSRVSFFDVSVSAQSSPQGLKSRIGGVE